MQPQPTEYSQQSTQNESSISPLSSGQDGVDPLQLYSTHGICVSGEHRPNYRSPEPTETGASQSSPDPSKRDHTSRLNVAFAEADTVPEHEGVHSWSSEAAKDATELRVSIGTSRHHGRSCCIEDLPNEVLVHVLTHLPPNALSTITLVSHRFHSLVTEPHAWRIAFGRYFPGAESLPSRRLRESDDGIVSSKREFTRLTAFASWRSEYILRPKLLDALRRGKPSHVFVPSGNSRHNRMISSHNAAQVTYPSRLLSPIDSLHCNFQAGPNKRSPRVVHGTSDLGKASASDPLSLKLDKVEYWGSGDPQMFDHFDERYPTEIPYGNGSGPLVGVPNSIDVSQVHGMIVGEGFPGGAVYYRSISEQRGRHLMRSRSEGIPEAGIPRLDPSRETICCVWIAKAANIPTMTSGMIGALSGSSFGIVTAYSTGPLDGSRGFARGEITARWVLSPGVPIISVVVDDNFNSLRLSRNRFWATALNALGEVFYITGFPTPIEVPNKTDTETERYNRAWKTGRSVFWSFIEPTRRAPKSDLEAQEDASATYSPRSSWDGMALSQEQIAAETHEIEQYVRKTPEQVRELCHGWDMQRRFEVDFAGDDENDAGEAVIVFECGLEDGSKTAIKRFKRLKVRNTSQSPTSSTDNSPPSSPKVQPASIFGGGGSHSPQKAGWSFSDIKTERPSSPAETVQSPRSEMIELWRESKLSLGSLKDPTITCTALDNSAFALVAAFEDPLFSMTASNTSTPQTTPKNVPHFTKPSEVVGQGARFVAAGTALGSILVWNMRAPSNSTRPIRPIRIIFTPDVREVSSLALTGLYLVHGDNEGVVQAWDPLASTTLPIRTLHSRFSNRHRRQLHEQYGIPWGSNANFFRAGPLALDPDPTVLRGVVCLGSHLHFWSYSSAYAAKYKPGKRRLRRSPRSSNQTPDRAGRLGRDEIQDYISTEQAEIERDEKAHRKEKKRLAGRFGTQLLGPNATDEEMMAYATMLSQEAAIEEHTRAWSETASSGTATDTLSSPSLASVIDPGEDPDLAKAVLLSLQESNTPPAPLESSSPAFDIPLRYAKKRGAKSPSSSPPPPIAGSSKQPETDDLEYALQLSRAEAESMSEWQDEFPPLSRKSSDETEGKGKGKGRRDG